MKYLGTLIIICFAALFACSNNADSRHLTNHTVVNPDNLKFTYDVDSIYPFLDGHIVDVNCNIYNGNNDTLYFFTYSCFGWEDNFIVNSNNIRIWSGIDCVVSNPILKEVPPKGYFNFKGHFLIKEIDPNELKLQYFIYQVDSDFDVNNKELIRNLKKTVIH